MKSSGFIKHSLEINASQKLKNEIKLLYICNEAVPIN
jgi:hypothetical protein